MSRYPTKPGPKKAPAKKKPAPKPQPKKAQAREPRTKKGSPAAKKARCATCGAKLGRVHDDCFTCAMARSYAKNVEQLAAGAMTAVNYSAIVPKQRRYRFRDAVTGLFLRARDAMRRKRTTVRESV